MSFFTWIFQVVSFILFFVDFDLYFCWFLMKTQEFCSFDVIFESGMCCLPRINFRTDEIGLKVVFVVFSLNFYCLKFLIFCIEIVPENRVENFRKIVVDSSTNLTYVVLVEMFA